MLTSIRSRLAFYILAGTLLLLVITAFVFDRALSRQLQREFDHTLLAKAQSLITLTSQEAGTVELDFADEFMPEFSATERAEYFELWLTDGTLIERSRSLRSAELIRSPPAPDTPRFENITLIDGRRGRLVEILFVPHIKDIRGEEWIGPEPTKDRSGRALSDLRAVLLVARGRDGLDQLIHELRIMLGAVVLVLVGGIAVVVRVSVARGLAPIDDIRQQVQPLGADSLGSRIRVSSASSELIPIATQLNNLLERLDDAFQRERRFSGNVAHELRTPLAELRALAEVGGRWPEDKEMVAGFFAELIGVADDMEQIVTNLLTLARCDAGREQVNMKTVELRLLIRNSWDRVAARAQAKGLKIDDAGLQDVHVETDPPKLELMLNNLFSNAIEYSPANGVVRVSMRIDSHKVEISIVNVTRNLSPGDLPMIFERFWRKDKARTGTRHAGLGLALVKALAEVLQLNVSPQFRQDRSFEITLAGLQST